MLRVGDGSTDLSFTDIVTDFSDGTDVLGLDDDLQYTDLTIAQAQVTTQTTQSFPAVNTW